MNAHNNPVHHTARTIALLRYEPIGILESTPRGKPEVAAPKADFDYGRVRADVTHVLPRHTANEGRLGEWDKFIADRPKSLEQAKVVSTLPSWSFERIPPEHNSLDDHRTAAARSVLNDLEIVNQVRGRSGWIIPFEFIHSYICLSCCIC